MYVKELFYGLNPRNKPSLSVFDNKYAYGKMLIEQNISLDSSCKHHFYLSPGMHILPISRRRK
jgi:GTP cyclohydrolase I